MEKNQDKMQAWKWIVSAMAILVGQIFFMPQFAIANPNFSQQPYCIAIRGNGELIPAHWGAMARTVEKIGLPVAMAGGSSASITQFLVEHVSHNPVAKQTNTDKQKQIYALLLKSLQAHFEYLVQRGQQSELLSLVLSIKSQAQKQAELINLIQRATSNAELKQELQQYLPLLNHKAISAPAKAGHEFVQAQLAEAYAVFGNFDAVGDQNLFFREGLIDFQYLARLFGHVADFYAGYTSPQVAKELESFIEQCADESPGKLWEQLSDQNCKAPFFSALKTYYSGTKFQNKAIHSLVEKAQIAVLPSTALIHGQAVERYEAVKKAYLKGDTSAASTFQIDFASELSFAYWGNQRNLGKLKTYQRNSSDLKSQKISTLANATWHEVLSVSPAEPGLANLQPLMQNTKDERGQKILSAGGWSDLHPTLVLKAIGCENILYLTRRGGESRFAQQAFMRLTGENNIIPFWQDLKSNNDQGWTRLNREVENTAWNQLYNLANPNSSFKKSLKAATAVYCTNWNAFSMGPTYHTQLIAQAWYSPVLLTGSDRASLQIFNSLANSQADYDFAGCQ